MTWYWWIVLWLVVCAGILLFFTGAHDDRFDERPLPQHHPPDGDREKNEGKDEEKSDVKWW